jgi:dual specificity protein kinase YAK1
MNNREAFIDFVQGLLILNPLERWTPSQAKHHPFITQQKFNGRWVPPMGLKSGSSRSPAPGVQQQQQAEAISKQRAQAAQAQAQSAAYANAQLTQPSQASYPQSPTSVYNTSMYNTSAQGPPPPYPSQSSYNQNIGMVQQPRYNPQPNLYAQATTRAGRQRASTMEQSGIPPALQRVVSHLDPNAPIRLQPSPAYYPPPQDGSEGTTGSSRRRGSRLGSGRRDFIRNLEDRTLEEGFMNSNHWQ